MLVDRYPPADLFALIPALYDSFEPVLRELDRLLDDDAIVQRVKGDLARRSRYTLALGRRSTPVEVILRLLVVKRLYNWSYEEVEHFVGDSLVLRHFSRVCLAPVPDDTTLLRWANLIGPATLEQLNEHVVALARSLKVTRGRKLGVDSTVVQTDIHYPIPAAVLARVQPDRAVPVDAQGAPACRRVHARGPRARADTCARRPHARGCARRVRPLRLYRPELKWELR